MPCSVRKFTRDETTDNANVSPTDPRVERLKDLISGGGPWGNNSKINLIYWYPDSTMPGGGHWVAWIDPDPLPAAQITIANA